MNRINGWLLRWMSAFLLSSVAMSAHGQPTVTTGQTETVNITVYGDCATKNGSEFKEMVADVFSGDTSMGELSYRKMMKGEFPLDAVVITCPASSLSPPDAVGKEMIAHLPSGDAFWDIHPAMTKGIFLHTYNSKRAAQQLERLRRWGTSHPDAMVPDKVIRKLREPLRKYGSRKAALNALKGNGKMVSDFMSDNFVDHGKAIRGEIDCVKLFQSPGVIVSYAVSSDRELAEHVMTRDIMRAAGGEDKLPPYPLPLPPFPPKLSFSGEPGEVDCVKLFQSPGVRVSYAVPSDRELRAAGEDKLPPYPLPLPPFPPKLSFSGEPGEVDCVKLFQSPGVRVSYAVPSDRELRAAGEDKLPPYPLPLPPFPPKLSFSGEPGEVDCVKLFQSPGVRVSYAVPSDRELAEHVTTSGIMRAAGEDKLPPNPFPLPPFPPKL